MKRENLTMKSAAELHVMLAQAQAALAKLRFDVADKKLKRTSDLPMTRRTIARIQTRLAESAKRAAHK